MPREEGEEVNPLALFLPFLLQLLIPILLVGNAYVALTSWREGQLSDAITHSLLTVLIAGAGVVLWW